MYLSPSPSNRYILSYLPQYKPPFFPGQRTPFNLFLFLPLSLRHSLMLVDAPAIPPSLVLATDLSLLLLPYDTASSGVLYTFLYFYHTSSIIKVLH